MTLIRRDFVLFCAATIWIFAAAGYLVAGEQQPPDVRFRESRCFRIDGKPDEGYRLSATVNVSSVLLSDPSLHWNSTSILVPWVGTLESVKVKRGSKQLEGDAVHCMPTRSDDVFLGRSSSCFIQFPDHLKVGDSLSYEYKVSYEKLVYFPLILVPVLNRVEQFDVMVEHPREIQLEFDVFYPRDSIETRVERSKPTRTAISLSGGAATSRLSYYPFNDFQAAVRVSVWRADSLLTPTTESALVRWYGAQVSLSPSLPLDCLDEPWQQALGMVPEADMLPRLSGLVRDEFRYIGDSRESHSIIPHDPERVYTRRYGDCKDRSMFLCAVGRAQGWNARCGLVSTMPQPEFPGTHLSQFDHMICVTIQGEDTVFLDPTARYFPTSELRGDLAGQQVLVLDPEAPWYATLPAAVAKPQLELAIQPDAVSPTRGPAQIVLRGDLRAVVLAMLEGRDSTILESILDDLVSERIRGVALQSPHLDAVGEDALVLKATADLESFLFSQDTALHWPATPFSIIEPSVLERDRDSLPVWIEGPKYWLLSLDLAGRLSAPSDSTMTLGTEEGALFQAHVETLSEGLVRSSYRFQCRGGAFAGSDKAALLELARKYAAAGQQHFTVRTTSP